MKKRLTEKEASAMTVNERLYHADLIDDYDKAVEERNRLKLKAILEEIYLSSENIEDIIEQELK